MTPSALHLLQERANQLVQSYESQRRCIGLMGFLLPAALIGWSIGFQQGMRNSISAYYYTAMGSIMVGTLCAIAVFLWSYKGYLPLPDERITDRATARTGAIGAALTVMAPIIPPPGWPQTVLQQIFGNTASEALHWIGAALFFGALSVFCLILFVRGDASKPRKQRQNAVYRACGVIILFSMAAIVLLKLIPGLGRALAPYHPVFWLEALAIVAFANSWLIKGHAGRVVQAVVTRLRAGLR